MNRIAIALLLAALPTLAIAQTVLKKEPASHALRSGQVVLVDDGSCPAGQIKEVTGGEGGRRGRRQALAALRAEEIGTCAHASSRAFTDMLSGQLALITAAVFAGAAIYVNVAEHPARMMLEDRSLLVQWKPAYKRGAMMQASLAIVGFLLGLAAWWQSGHWLWLAGALAMIAPWPWTLLGDQAGQRTDC